MHLLKAPVNESINDTHRRMKELQDENKQLKEELENCRRQINLRILGVTSCRYLHLLTFITNSFIT